MFETLAAMKSQVIMEKTYNGSIYVSTSIVKMYSYLQIIAFIPMFLFEGVLMYVYLERHNVSFAKGMYVSFFANIASMISTLFLFIVENMMNDLHFSSVFTAVYLVIIGFILTFSIETAVIYQFIKKDVKESLNKAAIISFCANLASHIGLLAFLSFV